MSAECDLALTQVKLEKTTALNQCYSDKQTVQTQLDSRTTETTNLKNAVSDCNKQKNDMQMSYDRLSGEYNKLMNQLILQQKNTNANNNQITILQDNLSRCQQQLNDNGNNSDSIGKQYNELAKNYQTLQNAYKNLLEEYQIKCYDYHVASQLTKPK
jgi:chromosome segregation ATPase